jgi:AraC-like DNA-binding protein
MAITAAPLENIEDLESEPFPCRAYKEELERSPGGEVFWHSSPNIELIVPEDNEVSITTPSVKFWFRPDEVAYIPSYVPHQIEAATEKVTIDAIVFDPSFVGGVKRSEITKSFVWPLITQKHLRGYKPARTSKHGANMHEAALSCFSSVSEEPPGYELAASIYASQFTQELYLANEKRIRRTATIPISDRNVYEIMRLISASYRQKTTINSIAAKINLTPRQTIRLFKNATGITPLQFLLAKRLRSAALELRSGTRKSVTAIAKENGFDSPSYFILQFKKYFGMTPQTMREKSNITKWTDNPLSAFENFFG